MPMILLPLNIALVLSFVVFVLALVKVRTLLAYLVAAYVIAYGDIVLVLQAAGLLNAVNRPTVLALQLLLTAGAFSLWMRAGRPAMWQAFAGLRLSRPDAHLRPWLKLISLMLVAGAVGYVYILEARLILAAFPHEYDALTYHLSRVGYWLQYRSFYPWPTPNPRQTTYPMNAELAVLWTILWWGTDRLSGFVQWTSIPVIMIGSYGLTRLLGYSRWQSAMTALLWATLTQVLYQSSTTQNDLVTASCWVAALYLFFVGLRHGRAELFLLSGLAFGLAIGTKSTSLLVLPGLGLAMIVVVLTSHRQEWFRSWFVRWIAACLLGSMLLGSYAYVQNSVAFGNPLGPSSIRTGPSEVQVDDGITPYAHRLRDNLARYAYQIVDFSPLPYHLADRLNPLKAKFFNGIFQFLRVSLDNPETIATAVLPAQSAGFGLDYINPLNEDSSWFGPLATVLAVAVVVQAYQGARRRDVLRLALAIIGISFLLVQSAAQSWTPYKGRYYMIPVALCMPLLACFLQTRTVWRAALASCIVLLALVVMSTVTLNTSLLPEIGWRDALSKTRLAPAWAREFNYRFLQEVIPPKASIGLVSNDDFRDYPFFGEHFTHRVTLAVPEDESIWPRVDLGRFVKDFQDSDYLVLVGGGSPSISDLARREFDLLSDYGGTSVWIRNELRAPTECDGAKWPFRDFYQSSEDTVVCPRYPIAPGITGEGSSGTLFFSGDKFVPVIGSGTRGRLRFDLLVKKAAEVDLSVRIDPRNFERQQTLQLWLSHSDSEPQMFSATFDRPRVLRFALPLQPNIYTVQIGLAGGSLQVGVRSIEVTTR